MFVHRFVPGAAPYAVLLLHGTGGDENDLIPIGKSLAPGAALLSPRGNVLENGAPRFFRRLGPGVFDEEDIKRQAAALAQFIKDSAQQYHFDGARVFALGYSNGANIAAALMLLHPDVLAGGVLLRPMPPLQPPSGPDLPPNLTDRPILIVAGEDDNMTSPELTNQLASTLSRAGAKVDVKWLTAGHELTPYDFQVVQAFFKSLPQMKTDK
jgi:phospholipase/carboxylesterase